MPLSQLDCRVPELSDARRPGGWPWLWFSAVIGFLALIAVAMQFEPGVATMSWPLFALTLLRHVIEVLCGTYAICFIIAAIQFWRRTRSAQPPPHPANHAASIDQSDCDPNAYPPVAVIYLCCNDVEEQALASLSRLVYPGQLLHIIHDDSTSPSHHQRLGRLVDCLERTTAVRWQVLRRPHKSGGKPGALQYVLDQTAHQHEFFLLADNDSYATDPHLLMKSLPSLADPAIAVVQFRNRTRVEADDPPFSAHLSGAIDMFDAFMTGLFEGLWRPFVGHNALLRTRAVVQAGGFTPGFFADDIDLTVRLNLRGQRVLYRRDLMMEERHPSNYRSFCLRSRKWAHGCAQVVRTHVLTVLASKAMTFREKIGFLLFNGFYLAQVAMLIYVLLVFLALPLMNGPDWTLHWWALILGTLVPIAIFLPVGTYLLTEGRHMPFFRTLGACAATYGSTDVWTLLGLLGGFRKRERRWIPTNSVFNGDRPWLDWGHFAFGAGILLLPLQVQPQLLMFPVTWLFAAKFLFVPAVAVHYGGEGRAHTARQIAVPRFVNSLALWAFVLWAIAAGAMAPLVFGQSDAGAHSARVKVDGSRLLIDDEPLVIRGVHYSPWRPGTGPGRGFEYPSDDEIAADLRLIKSLNANTILVYDAPARAVDLAHQMDMNVLYVFSIQWWKLTMGESKQVADDIVAGVKDLRGKPAIVAWMIGNEVSGWVIDELKPEGVRQFLSSTRDRIRQVDSTRPVTHGNWPLSRTLNLDRDMDIVCYNIYPFYPTEVIARGYREFIEREIKPLAAGRPLVITEFGVNTIEVSQERHAQVLRECWRDLRRAGAQGGVVFAFADEWWKNYDNPIGPPDWWRRQEAPDDHLAHDQDPEEHYGIVTADRKPKLAFNAVREMFGEAAPAPRNGQWGRVLWWLAASACATIIFLALWLRWVGQRRRLLAQRIATLEAAS